MNNKKGFTLIELLAVILILAIIALIAIPVVTNIINDAKKHALKDSAYGIIDATDLYFAKNMKSITTNLEFDCSNNKCEASTNKLDFKGEVKEGKVKLFNDGKVSICIENETYAAYKNAATDEVTVAKGTCNYSGDEYTVDELVSLSDFNDMKAQYEAQISTLQEQLNNYDSGKYELDLNNSISNHGWNWGNVKTTSTTVTIPAGVTKFQLIAMASAADGYVSIQITSSTMNVLETKDYEGTRALSRIQIATGTPGDTITVKMTTNATNCSSVYLQAVLIPIK